MLNEKTKEVTGSVKNYNTSLRPVIRPVGSASSGPLPQHEGQHNACCYPEAKASVLFDSLKCISSALFSFFFSK